jgi:hypothetical protein
MEEHGLKATALFVSSLAIYKKLPNTANSLAVNNPFHPQQIYKYYM